MGLLILVLSIKWLGYGLKDASIIHVHVFAFSLYFGLYAFLDSFFKSNAGLDLVPLAYGYILIISALFIMIFLIKTLLPDNRAQLFNLDYIFRDISVIRNMFIYVIFVILVSIRLYAFKSYGVLSRLYIMDDPTFNMPYWFKSVYTWQTWLGLFVFMASALKWFDARGFKQIQWLMIGLIQAALIILFGRREMMNLIIISAFVFGYRYRLNIFRGRSLCIFGFLGGIAILIYGVLFSNYRWAITMDANNILHNYQEYNPTNQGLVKLTDNLSERESDWIFLYRILDRQMDSRSIVPYGSIIRQGLFNLVPSILNKHKNFVELDEFTDVMYGFPITDEATTPYTMFIADFGVCGVFLLPFVILSLFMLMGFLASIRIVASLYSILIRVMFIDYLMRIESAYTDCLVLARDAILILFVFFAFRIVSVLHEMVMSQIGDIRA